MSGVGNSVFKMVNENKDDEKDDYEEENVIEKYGYWNEDEDE